MQFDKTIINLNIKSVPDFVPTRKHGIVGKNLFHSGNHLPATSSNENGEITETRIRKTSVPGKNTGLSLS